MKVDEHAVDAVQNEININMRVSCLPSLSVCVLKLLGS